MAYLLGAITNYCPYFHNWFTTDALVLLNSCDILILYLPQLNGSTELYINGFLCGEFRV